MTNRRETPYSALKRIFHEPSRMAIMTALCTTEEGLGFGDLKLQCDLTDGNLNRHLKALADTGAVRVIKTQQANRARTVIHITNAGREHFVDYLHTLENVLRHTAEALANEEGIAKTASVWHIPLTVR